MKCLVFSDSHGASLGVVNALRAHKDAEVVFFLGDGLREIDSLMKKYPDKAWIAVRGNCDFYPYFNGEEAEKTVTLTLSGYRITATHGDLYGVKYASAGLVKLAADARSDIVLFGHTHERFGKSVAYSDRKVLLFNPGSVSDSFCSFGVLMLDEEVEFSFESALEI